MNKTIIININGIIFHIEEDAYEVLKNYMTDVKRHFANAEDSLEITTDIENRIAEMLSDMLARENRQVVVAGDIAAIIAQMGTVEDFETSGADHKDGFAGYQTFTDNRKLFRDPDDHLLGGVCAGIANYFDMETVWIRIAFAIAFCFGGTGLMLYIILWIVVPKAESRADRMAMKGEKLNLEGFKRNFEEELKNVHATFKSAGTEARPFVYKARDFFGDFLHHFGVFLQGFGRVLLKMFGVIILMMCFGFFVAALVGFIAILGYSHDIYHLFPFTIIAPNNGHNSMIFFSAFALVVIPIIAIAALTLKVVFNTVGLNKSAGYTLLIVWIGSLSIVIYYTAKIANQFKVNESFTQTINIKPNKAGVYHLTLNDIKFLTKEDSMRMDINRDFNGRVIMDDDNHDNGMPRNVEIYVEKTDQHNVVLEERFSAQGANDEDALRNARGVKYNFIQKDSLLTFDRSLQIPHGKLWRDQRVKLTLKIPVGTILVIDENLNYLINDTDVGDCKNKNKEPNWTSAPFMMEDGGLGCKVDTLFSVPAVIPQPIAK